jgi:hypothetical protein
MSRPFLVIVSVERRLATGNTENLDFKPGVNLFVGPPNTGKTNWLKTLDFLLGDSGENPFEGAEETGLAEKYEAAAAKLEIGDEQFRIERRWREPGAKTKIFVGEESMTPRDFQHWLMGKLGIPLLHFPKGNPMSGQTWPELSFRMILRHIYRQQGFWSDIADKQPEAEQHACLLQILGVAERIFTKEYGELIRLKTESERLKARRDQYRQTLEDLARDIVSEPGLTVGVNAASVQAAQERLNQEIGNLRQRRGAILSGARDQAVPAHNRGRVNELGQKRAETLVRLEGLKLKGKATEERLSELRRYRSDLAGELERMARVEDAGAVLADLKITHCPACDQPVSKSPTDADHCFLCHQQVGDTVLPDELGAVRLRFEQDRLNGELKEAVALVDLLERDGKRIVKDAAVAQEDLRMLENELAPARQAVSALVQEEISAIDMALGEANERQRQIGRIAGALRIGERLTEDVREIEAKIEPLQEAVEEVARATDFDAAVGQLEDGMNAYLNAINQLRPKVWRHSAISIDVSRSSFAIRVGKRRWQAALGGTDTLYFLMAYQYGLLSLSSKPGNHYPGLCVIDVPAEFSGEAVEDKENFIVQPFIDLLRRDGYSGAQLLITGASFTGLQGAHRRQLTHVFTA